VPTFSHHALGTPEVGGVLIGGASLPASDFDAIVAAARERAPAAIG
jgi:triosephosphate isomerase